MGALPRSILETVGCETPARHDLHLVGRQRDSTFGKRGVRLAHLPGGIIAHTHRFDLPRIHGVRDKIHQPGNRKPPVGVVMLIQVNRIASYPRKR